MPFRAWKVDIPCCHGPLTGRVTTPDETNPALFVTHAVLKPYHNHSWVSEPTKMARRIKLLNWTREFSWLLVRSLRLCGLAWSEVINMSGLHGLE
jgi:hypothetical protein